MNELEANHFTSFSFVQGVYVLTDSAFRPFARMSMAVRGDAVSMAQAVWNILPYLPPTYLPTYLLRLPVLPQLIYSDDVKS